MPPETFPDLRDANILVVDDDPALLHLVGEVLQRAGVPPGRIARAGSAEEAQRLLRERRFHVVVSDHAMPGMAGGLLLAWVAEHDPAAGRVLMTGVADLAVGLDEVSRGRADALVAKPLSLPAFLDVLESILALKQARLARPGRGAWDAEAARGKA